MIIKASDHLTDSMSASFIANVVPQANIVDSSQSSFVKEFEKVETRNRDSVELSDNSRSNHIDILGNRDQRDKFSKDADESIIKKGGKEAKDNPAILEDAKTTHNKPNPEETNKNPEQKEQPDNTVKSAETSKAKSNGSTGDNKLDEARQDSKNDLKALLQEHLLKKEQISKIKIDIKENFTEGKNIEKVMLNRLETQSKGISDTARLTDTKSAEKKGEAVSKTNDDSSTADKKLVQELEIGKVDPSLSKNEAKVQKKETSLENSPLSLLNDNPRGLLRNDFQAEVKKAANPSRLLEQYQELREKITGTVENTIKMLMVSNENRMTIQLHPPELGRVQVELVVKDNQVNARINTENQAVKEVVLTNMNQLKSNLEEAGIQVTRLDVEVGGFKNQFEQHFSQGNPGNGKRESRGGGSEAGAEAFDYLAEKVKNHQPLSYFLGRSINCLI